MNIYFARNGIWEVVIIYDLKMLSTKIIIESLYAWVYVSRSNDNLSTPFDVIKEKTVLILLKAIFLIVKLHWNNLMQKNIVVRGQKKWFTIC